MSEVAALVERLQRMADGLRAEPLPILLGKDPGPYRLPECTRASLSVSESGAATLILDTDVDQRILIPMPADVLVSLASVITLVNGRGNPTP